MTRMFRLERLAFSFILRLLSSPILVLVSKRERMLLRHLWDSFSAFQASRNYTIVSLGTMVNPTLEVMVTSLPAEDYNVTEYELLCLSAITKHLLPKEIFEFGTSNGRSTLAFLNNSGPATIIHTLNLPVDDIDGIDSGVNVGSRFLGHPDSMRVDSLFGNSRSFDFARYHNKMDMIFIDADHSAEGVLSDTRNALRMINKEEGVVIWHDALRYGVRKILPGLGMPVCLLADTNLAFLRFRDGHPLGHGRG